MKVLQPDIYVNDVLGIDLDALKQDGIDTLFIDLDNTILSRDAAEVTGSILEWVTSLEQAGFITCIVSNNWHSSAIVHAEKLQMDIVAKAIKPLPFAFRQALVRVGSKPSRTAMIGDQIFTDILGGNLLGMKTVLVKPLSACDLPHTLLLRRLERLVLAGREPLD